jgi:membrane-associated phospholipid phosphatase
MARVKSRASQSDSNWREKFIVEERFVPSAVRQRLYLTAWVLIIIGLVVFTVLLFGVVTHTGFQRLDQPVETWFLAHRSAMVTTLMIVLAVAFGPVTLPIVVFVVVVIWTLLAKHVWRPLLLTAGMVSGLILAQVLAPLVRHPRPPIGSMLLGADSTFSFPSGHVLGTSDFLLLLAFLIASRLQKRGFTIAAVSLAVILILAQIVSRLYLGYHWISDTTGSLALSMVVLGIVMTVDTARTVRIPGERVEGAHSQAQVDGS